MEPKALTASFTLRRSRACCETLEAQSQLGAVPALSRGDAAALISVSVFEARCDTEARLPSTACSAETDEKPAIAAVAGGWARRYDRGRKKRRAGQYEAKP
jgi:hypothetical protein